jgi:hypothetical protein
MNPMKELTFSYHFQKERADRIDYINNTVGFGEEIVVEVNYENKRECVTNTGVLLVMAKERDFVITAYIANFSKVWSMCKINELERVPQELYKVVKDNAYHWQMQNGYAYC